MARLEVEIGAKIQGLLTELGKAKKALAGIGIAAEKLVDKLKRVGEKMGRIGKSMSTYLTLPLAAIATASIKMASDFTESLNKVDVAFKESSKQVREFAKTTLETFGIAEGTALDMSALFGDMATSMGVPTEKAADLATQMVGLAGDMSSFKNIGIKEVTTALNGVFTGETESLKRMGIVMTIANLKTFALTQGMNDNIEAMTQAQKVQLRYAYILSVTKNAQGDFARTSEGSANQMRIFSESVKELSVSFGKVLLPLFTKIITQVNKVVKGFTALSPATKKIIVIVGALVAVIGPLLIALGFLSTTIIPALITGFGILLGPIGLITAAVVALGVVVYKNFDGIIHKVAEFYNSFVDVYNQSTLLRGVISGIGVSFKNVFIVAKMAFKNIWSFIKGIGSNISNLFMSLGKVISGALTFDLTKLKEGLLGVKNTVGNTFTEISGEVKKNAKEAAEQISKNFTDALDTTLNGHLEKKTPLQIKESLSSLANSLKETAKEAGKVVGLEFAKGVTSGSTGGRKKATGLDLPKAVGLADLGATIPIPEINTAPLINNLQDVIDISPNVMGAFDGIGSAIGGALTNGTSVLGAIGNVLLSTIGDIAVKLGQTAIGIGLAMMAIKLSFTNPFTAIAAGIALVAIGSAIKGVSGIVSGGGGSGMGGQTGSSNFSGSIGGGNFGASNSSSGGTYVFEIQGTKLVGVLSNTLARNRSLGGSLGLI
jgi:hypothetical protein